ncbi:hypothetical protein DL96DRAFT_1802128 [Flagelloscypha sp. PMI_526]|nr:hypothetical protein DL96DRAFT_1802128 [Flagelloscypha sp. PMI_526]
MDFVIEGFITFVVTIAAFFVMRDHSESARFLSTEEKMEVVELLELDRSSLADELQHQIYLGCSEGLKDLGAHAYRYWYLHSALFYLDFPPNIGQIIISTAQLIPVLSYVLSAYCCITGGHFADRYRQ